MLFSKKKEEEKPESEEEEVEPKSSETLSLVGVNAKLEKLEAHFSSFYEMQKMSSERFSAINEQIGELRAMIIDKDKEIQRLEAKSAQAIDMVKTVEPDKLMIEVRKVDGKIEALRANLESNENMMNNALDDLKDMRGRIASFRGLEEVMKLSEEIKSELLETKKVKATTERHAEKVETIFSELQKRLIDFQKSGDITRDLEKASKRLTSDLDSTKIKIDTLSSKKDVENLITRFEDLEQHNNNVINLMNKRFETFQKSLEDDINKKVEKADKLVRGFKELALKTPDLDKYFNLLEEEAKKLPEMEKVEKIKDVGKEEVEEFDEEEPEEEKKGLFSKLKKGLSKKEEE